MILDKIENAILYKEDLGNALQLLKQVINEHTDICSDTLLAGVESDYSLMKDYLLKGYKDKHRANVYNDLLKRIYKVYCDVNVKIRANDVGLFPDSVMKSVQFHFTPGEVRRNLESFVQETAMLSLESEQIRNEKSLLIFDNHKRTVNYIFEKIVLSSLWNEDSYDFYKRLVLSPTIDINDALIIVSAVMLSAMNLYDENKVTFLIDVYVEAVDERLRQRALVGWVFSLPNNGIYSCAKGVFFSKLTDIIGQLCADESVRRELLELQMQIVYCLNAEKDNETIQREIMPNLMKNNNFKITRFGIKEKEEDSMQDILGTGDSDKAMEDLEFSFNNMLNMQKSGSDIYFGGFSQMKRFPFFKDIDNWFCPFYVEHPDLVSMRRNEDGSKIMEMLFTNGPFCDSDKYSFVIAMSSIINSLPDNVREIMGNDDVFGSTVSDVEKQTPAYIRRMYLQDLYRFFRIYPRRHSYRDPFDNRPNERSAFFFNKYIFGSSLNNEAQELKQFLIKKKLYEETNHIYTNYSFPNNTEDLLMSATLSMRLGKYNDAQMKYEKVLESDSDNVRALKGLANSCFYASDYIEAEEYYKRLLDIYPDNRNYLLNLSVSQLYNNRSDEGIAGLYKLNYQSPNDIYVKRALGWALMSVAKVQMAEKLFSDLLLNEQPDSNDYLNAAYSQWFMGNVNEGANLFVKYLSCVKSDNYLDIVDEFVANADLFATNSIDDTEVKLMVDIIRDKYNG